MMTRVAAVQTKSTADIKRNIDDACQLIQQAATKGAQLVVIPENFATLGLSEDQKQACAEDYESGPIQEAMANVARENKIWLVAGTIPIKVPNEDNRVTASSLLYDPHGNVASRYDKIHLFDVTIGGVDEYRESKHINPGDAIKIVQTPIGTIGLSICYDLRFPELFRSMMRSHVDIIVLPSAFTIPTGEAHWEILVRARAIENLCYMIAPGEVGIRSDGRGTYGHTMIVGPWGEILAHKDMEPGIILADCDLEKMHKLRQEFPATSNVREFVFQNLVRG